MLSLPAEICYDFSRYLNHRDYTRLRRTCKFLSRLDSIQYLYFQSYKDSADSIGNDPELLSQALLSQIRLDNQCLDDDSFLYMAINGHSAEFIRLFQTNACVNISTKAKDEAFIEIIENFNSKDMICELLRDGLVNATLSVTLAVPFSVIAEDEEDEELHNRGTALHWACINGYVDVVQLLLKYDNVDVSSKDNHDNAPIHYAADVGHTEIVKLLLHDQRVDPTSLGYYNKTSLHLSAQNGHFDIVELLLDDGRIDHMAIDHDGDTCLHFAANGGHLKIVDLLLNDGRIDPMAINYFGETYEHMALNNHGETYLDYLH